MRSAGRHRETILYGFMLAMLIALLKWLEFRLLIIDHAIEIYAGSIALIFTLLGIWLAMKLARPKTVVIEKEVAVRPPETFILNEAEAERLSLSKRELDVLALMAAGHSNSEIAGKLFISLNTVKSHSSRIFEKLEVSRRTQAVEKGRRLSLIP